MNRPGREVEVVGGRLRRAVGVLLGSDAGYTPRSLVPLQEEVPEPEFPVIYGGLPFDAIELADAEVEAQKNTLQLTHQIDRVTGSFYQALHTTAYKQNEYLDLLASRQGKTRQRRWPSLKRRGPEIKTGSWTLKKKSNGYEVTDLNFHQEKDGSLTVDSLVVNYKELQGSDPFAQVAFSYGPDHHLAQIDLRRFFYKRGQVTGALDQKPLLSFVQEFGIDTRTLPPYGDISSWVRFTLNSQPKILLAYGQRGEAEYLIKGERAYTYDTIYSEFQFDPYRNIFIRRWDDSAIKNAKRYGHSLREEMPTEEYLTILSSFFKLVPKADISSYYRATS